MIVLSEKTIDDLINKHVAKFTLIQKEDQYYFLILVNAPGNLTGWANSNSLFEQKWILQDTVEIEKRVGFFKKEIEQCFLFTNGEASFLFPAFYFLPLLNFLMEKKSNVFTPKKLLKTSGLKFSLPK